MKAYQIMTTDVSVVHVETTVDEVVRILTSRRISSVPVVDDDYRILGLVSEDDLFMKEKGIPFSAVKAPTLFRKWADPQRADEVYAAARQHTAADVMTSDVPWVEAEDDVGKVTLLMVQQNLHRVPVARDGRLVGIISRIDLIRMLANAE
jgi:CBS domain-containing protein